MNEFIKKYLYLLPLLLLCSYYLIKVFFFPIHDFGNYYFASLLYKLNTFSTEVYNPCLYNTVVHDMGYEFLGSYFPFTPITSLFYYPFSFFKPIIAKLIFNGISIILFLHTLTRIFNLLKIDKIYLLFLPIIFLVPIKNGILFGQFYILLFVLITESYIFYEKDKKWISAILLTIAISIKIFPVLLIFWFISEKDYKQIVKIMGVGIVFLITSLLLNGMEFWQFYFTKIFIPSLQGNMGFNFQLNYQSIPVFLKYLLVKDTYFNPHSLFDNYKLYWYLLISIKTIILTFGVIMPSVIKNKKIRFGLWILIMLLLSSNGSTYFLILLLLPLLTILSEEKNFYRKLVAILFVLLISNIPWDLFNSQFLIFNFIRLFLILSFFFVLINWYFKKIFLLKFIIIFLFILGIQLFKPIPKKQNGETIYGGKSLISNYEIVNNNLIIEEFTIKGVIKKRIEKLIIKPSMDSVVLKDNQIYLNGKKITNTKDNKLHPEIVNNKIFFLSDYNQGYKFYNLRSITFTKK